MKINKNLQKVLFLLMMCVFALLIYKIIDIYAVFHSEVDANVKLENGIWNITVNGTKITTGVETEFVVNQISTTGNNHVKPGTIAPGLSGTFEMAINPEDTNVSVRYDITLNQEKLGDTNLQIKSIKEVENNYQLMKTGENMYTGIIPLQDIQNGIIHKIQMEIQWMDDGLNNEADSELGKNGAEPLQIPITVHVIQYLGENITTVTDEQGQES
ncbi:MAG: hypothetical protein IJE68_00290 [Clostridia bacterium]|nr:hypothetical protein [Clostridia bacterium]